MTQTLDQQRAKLAWQYASAGIQQHGKDYKNLAKGAPALIMNSGLMPTLAFYGSKKKDKPLDRAAQQLLCDLLTGMTSRLSPQPTPHDLPQFLKMLQECQSQDYLRYTSEALELLKWIRQFVDAVSTQEVRS